MKITKVKYSKLVSDNNYNNASCGAEADVGKDQTPEDAFTELAYWVNDQLSTMTLSKERVDELKLEVAGLENEKTRLERHIFAGKEKFKWLETVLEKHGITLEDEIPF